MAEASSTEEGITLRIRFKSETLEKFVGKYASDLGPTEIFVRTREPLPVGTWLNFEFTLQDGGPLLAGRGVVSWTRALEAGMGTEPAGMSIRFEKLAPASQQLLTRMLEVKSRLPGQSSGKGGLTPTPSPSDPERYRKTTPYRTVVPDDPAAALAAAGSLSAFGRGKPSAATSRIGGPLDAGSANVSAKTSPGRPATTAAGTRDLSVATPEDGERTEVARMPPSFYYDAADDEATRVRIDERDAESITPLDDLDDITSPRAEIPVAAAPPPRPDLSLPWRPPTPPVAGSLAASLRPPLGTHGRGGANDSSSWNEPPPRHTISYAGTEAGSMGSLHQQPDIGSASLRPTRTRMNALEGIREVDASKPSIGPDQPTPRPELDSSLLERDGADEEMSGYESAAASYGAATLGGQSWDTISGARRGGTMKVWLFTASAAAAVIIGALWLVPRYVIPRVATTTPPPGAAPADPAADPAATPALAMPAAGQAGAPPATGQPTPAGSAPAAPVAAGTPGAPAAAAGSPGAAAGTKPASASASASASTKSGNVAAVPAAGSLARAGGPVVEPLPGAARSGTVTPSATALAARPVRKVRNVRPRRPVASLDGDISGPSSDVPSPTLSPSVPGTPPSSGAPSGGASPPPAPPPVALSTAPSLPSSAPGQPSPAAVAGAITGGPVPANGEEEVYWLNVKSVPAGADVLIDGQIEGKTPFQRRIFDPGRTYALSIRKPGFESVERSLTSSDQWLRRGNVRTLTINARLMATTLAEPPVASEPGVSARPPAPEAPSLPPTPPAVPPKANPFDEAPAGRTP